MISIPPTTQYIMAIIMKFTIIDMQNYSIVPALAFRLCIFTISATGRFPGETKNMRIIASKKHLSIMLEL